MHSVPPAGAGLAVPLSTIPTKRHGGSFRLSAGLGYWYTDFQHEPIAGSGASEASSFSGEGITTGIAIEGASSRNISVFGELLGSFIRDPSIKSPFGYSSAWDGTYALVSLGRGVAYYFDQLDIYASATLTMTRLFGKRTDAGAASAPPGCSSIHCDSLRKYSKAFVSGAESVRNVMIRRRLAQARSISLPT